MTRRRVLFVAVDACVTIKRLFAYSQHCLAHYSAMLSQFLLSCLSYPLARGQSSGSESLDSMDRYISKMAVFA